MWRRLRWVILALVLVAVGGAVALVVVEQPELDHTRRSVDARWKALRPSLDDRYAKLAATLTQLSDAGAGDRSVGRSLDGALAVWTESVRRADAGAEADAANQLESGATRLHANIAASPRLSRVGALTGALAAFDDTPPPATLVTAYNDAVQRYQRKRAATLGVPVARVLGFDERPVLVVGT
jgi:hypothetical protein